MNLSATDNPEKGLARNSVAPISRALRTELKPAAPEIMMVGRNRSGDSADLIQRKSMWPSTSGITTSTTARSMTEIPAAAGLLFTL